MKIKEIIERHSTLILISGLLIGASTEYFSSFDFLVRYILMFMMFISFLKVEYQRIIHYVKRPGLIFSISFFQMLVFPVAVFLALNRFISNELMVAVLLLVSLPSAIISPVLTGMFRGETNLSVVLVVMNYIVAVFSIPLLFYFLVGKKLSLDLGMMSLSLFQLIIIPMIFAAIVLARYGEKVRKIDPYFASTGIVCVFIITVFALSPYHDYIFQNLHECLNMLFFQSFIFASLFVLYLVPLKLERVERKTVTLTKCFMNNMLGLVLAVEFFGPFYTLFMALTEIMWVFMFMAAKKIYT